MNQKSYITPKTLSGNTMTQRDNLHISKFKPLASPKELKERLPLSPNGNKRVINDRKRIQDILGHNLNEFIVIVGPCSIHNTQETLEYAKHLKKLSAEVNDKLMIIMARIF